MGVSILDTVLYIYEYSRIDRRHTAEEQANMGRIGGHFGRDLAPQDTDIIICVEWDAAAPLA